MERDIPFIWTILVTYVFCGIVWIPIAVHKVGGWIGPWVAHLSYMVVALALMAYTNRPWSHYGLTLTEWERSLQMVALFTLVWFIILVAVVLIPLLMRPERAPAEVLVQRKRMSAFRLIEQSIFQWLFVGLTEEMLFRGWWQTELARYTPGSLSIANLQLSHAALWSAIAFGAWHLGNLSYQSFAYTVGQALLGVVTGLLFGYMRQETGSLLAPVVCHGALGGLLLWTRYLKGWLFSRVRETSGV